MHLHSYDHDSPLGSSPLGYYEEKLHGGTEMDERMTKFEWTDNFMSKIQSKSSRPLAQWKGMTQEMRSAVT